MAGIPPPSPEREPATPPARWSERLKDWWTSYLAGASFLVLVGLTLAALATLGFVALIVITLFAVSGLLPWLLVLGIAAIPLAILAHARSRPEPAPPLLREIARPEGSPFGDAGWAYRAEIEAHGLVPRSNEAWFGAIWLGRPINVEWHAGLHRPIADLFLGYRGENNIITFSSAGGGKNAAAIIPTLLINGQSAFVLDPKGENWFTTQRTRTARFGHRIVCINPFNLYGRELGYAAPMTQHFNPLAALRPEQPDFVTSINTLAEALITADGDKRHWTDRARALCAGIMAQLCADPAYRERGENTLPQLRRILGLTSDLFAAWCQTAVAQSELPIVRDNLGSYCADTDEVKDVIATACGQLHFLNEPALIAFLSKSDFDFADLRREPMTIYCMIPPALMDTYASFLRVMVQSCFNALSGSPLTERAPVLLVLDEQAKLGPMPVIKTAAATLRGYNVRIWSVFQDISQLKSLYPDAWETFLANAGLIQVMTVNDAVTAAYFSDKVGKRGVQVLSTSTSHSSNRNSGPHGSSGSSSSSSNSVNEQALPFLTPQHFYNQPKGYGIVLLQGLAYPISVERLGYHERHDSFGVPNFFQPWPDSGLPAVEAGPWGAYPYTPNAQHHPEALVCERARRAQETARQAMLQALDVAKAEGRAYSPLPVREAA